MIHQLELKSILASNCVFSQNLMQEHCRLILNAQYLPLSPQISNMKIESKIDPSIQDFESEFKYDLTTKCVFSQKLMQERCRLILNAQYLPLSPQISNMKIESKIDPSIQDFESEFMCDLATKCVFSQNLMQERCRLILNAQYLPWSPQIGNMKIESNIDPSTQNACGLSIYLLDNFQDLIFRLHIQT